MKRINLFSTIIFILLVIISFNTYAQSNESIDVTKLFVWAVGDTPNWGKGALYAALGLVGALIALFHLVGGAIPGTAGSVRIEAGLKRVEEREKILDRLINSPDQNPEKIKAVEIATNNLRDDLARDRRRQWRNAATLYAILGAFFAALLAQDLLQALLIGAGWTAYLGAIGLKKDYAERKSLKDETTENLESALSKVREESGKVDNDTYKDLLLEAEVSKAI